MFDATQTASHADTVRLKALESCYFYLQRALNGPAHGDTVKVAADNCAKAADRAGSHVGHVMAVDALAAAHKQCVLGGFPIPPGYPERMISHTRKINECLEVRA
ncbi:MAG: hypothetical protein AAF183_18020 [Pseudomonadota bacterium]